jgi:hypothetical protein
MLARGGTITLTRIITLPLIILLLLVSGAMTIADGLGLNF